MNEESQKIEALQEQLEKVKHQSQLKDQFFASIAHELRTPMNAVIGLSQILLQSELSGKQREYISKIESSGTILVELVSDILDFAKIEAGKLSIEDTVFDMNDILDNVAQILAIKAHEKGIELIFDIEDRIGSVVRGDPLRLGQIIINLMGNAIKFTESGEVALLIRTLDDTTIEFHVKDTGIGLTQDQIGRLFQNFTQASSSTSRKYGGTGLGLTISKQLINLMGGEIYVESQFGQGSEFIFTIKTRFEPDKRLYHLPSKDLVGKKVLLIDQNQSTLSALVNMLNYFKYNATVQSDINEAEALIENEAFDIVFIDMKMIKLLKNEPTPHAQETKIVVLNSGIELNEQESINGISIDAYLFKPFNLHKVFELILKVYQREIVSIASKESKLTKRDLVRLKGSHIAVAEDNKINQTVITAMLEDTEIKVSLFDNGQELVEYLESTQESIDLVFMDVNMPIMDGLEATHIIRAQKKYSELPIIALSASKAQKDIDKALKSGMTEHLSKPIYMDKLYAILIKYIHSKVEKNTPKLEDLILFSAKFNASIRKFEELFKKAKSDEMQKLMVKMEKEANRVDIDMLNGLTSVLQDIFTKREEALKNFVFEYDEAASTFFKACDLVKNNLLESIDEEERNYAFQVLSYAEGLELFDGAKEPYNKALIAFYEQFENSLSFIKHNIHDTQKLQNFVDELSQEAQKINANIMLGLSRSLGNILNKEQEELQKFIEKYQHAFDASTYQN
ncbi:MAG: response regulator [Campylobacterota bacterium]|nr:response regulator [Campylobacterota bacterium]